MAAAYLSMKRGLLTKEEYQEICQGCSDYDLPVHVDGLIPEEVLSATKKDKKNGTGTYQVYPDGWYRKKALSTKQLPMKKCFPVFRR